MSAAAWPTRSAAAISLTSPGSQLAPQASGVGIRGGPYSGSPVRHSSWASAGIPNRLAATTPRLQRGERATPAAA